MRRASGIATVEFALVAPLLMLLLAGILDFSMLLRTAACTANAARAGAEYATRSAASSLDFAGMQAAAINSSPHLAGLTATASRACRCSDGSAVSCGGSCASGSLRVYAQVNAQAAVHTVFAYPGLSVAKTASAQAVVRVQ
jgi:Flp pilus assembly protein TadG